MTTTGASFLPAGAPAAAIVDLAAIRDNVRALRAHAPNSGVMAVVKADGYGHGVVPAAWAAIAGGAGWLGVAQASEALALRAAGILVSDARILTWLHSTTADFAALVAANVDVAVSAPWALDGIAEAARTVGRTARVQLKVDTGLGRNGVTPADLAALAARAAALQASGEIVIGGVWSHLAYADEPGHPTIARQRVVFDEAVRTVEAAGIEVELRHLANSAATLTAPGMHYDVVRPGLAVYGLSPVPGRARPSDFGLRPAMTLQARLATVKDVPAGQGVSYGHAYVTSAATRLAVVPLGYSDGVPRHASGGSMGVGGPVHLPDGRIARVAGRVCMDQFMLDLGAFAKEQAGDVVTLFGASDGLEAGASVPNAQDWAEAAGTISYEIITRIGARIPRVYTGVADLGGRAAAALAGFAEGARQAMAGTVAATPSPVAIGVSSG